MRFVPPVDAKLLADGVAAPWVAGPAAVKKMQAALLKAFTGVASAERDNLAMLLNQWRYKKSADWCKTAGPYGAFYSSAGRWAAGLEAAKGAAEI